MLRSWGEEEEATKKTEKEQTEIEGKQKKSWKPNEKMF